MALTKPITGAASAGSVFGETYPEEDALAFVQDAIGALQEVIDDLMSGPVLDRKVLQRFEAWLAEGGREAVEVYEDLVSRAVA